MNSHWFKFYGQDWLTDIKVIGLSLVDRMCYLTLLCLASTTDDGVIKKCKEESIIGLTHIYKDPTVDGDYYDQAKGCLQRYQDNGMITIDNDGNVTVVNFMRRQEGALTGYERIKKYREKQKEVQKKVEVKPKKANDNEMITQMITPDKIREDKIREDNSIVSECTPSQISKFFFLDPECVIQEMLANGLPEQTVRFEVGKFINYWTELNKSGKKQRWELEKTFEVKKRLGTWFRNIANKQGNYSTAPKAVRIS